MKQKSMKKWGSAGLTLILLAAAAGCAFNFLTEGNASDSAKGVSAAESQGVLQPRSIYTDELENFQYLLYVPEHPAENMPLIVYLHGVSGRGEDLSLLTLEEDFPKFLQDGDLGEIEAYAVIPQLPSSQDGWSGIYSSLYTLIQETVSEYSIDETNISLAGFSMGGVAAWEFAAAYPELFSRVAPLAGSARGVLKQVPALKEISVWAFAGSADTVINPNSSMEMVHALKKAGGTAELTVFDGAGHASVPSLAWLDGTIGLVDWLTACPQTPDMEPGKTDDNEMKLYRNSDFIEKEQPELSEETKERIFRYQKDPVMENYLSLWEMVIKDYDAVLERKETKLEELKQEAAGKPGGDEIIAEMEDLVQEMHTTYWERIDSNMLRFTDPRLLEWKISDAYQYEYIPVMGAGESIYVKRTPVTNAEYAQFLADTGYVCPSNWIDHTYPEGEDELPVNFVSFEDAQTYCIWLTEQDGINTYRMPSEMEWELAAGHMPKDADFNCGVNDQRTPVEQYAETTRGAHGAIDFWGNVWEWTSTERSSSDDTIILGVKGGSWKSDRTDCRTEFRGEGRDGSAGYEDTGFRVIQVLKGEEPAAS